MKRRIEICILLVLNYELRLGHSLPKIFADNQICDLWYLKNVKLKSADCQNVVNLMQLLCLW